MIRQIILNPNGQSILSDLCVLQKSLRSKRQTFWNLCAEQTFKKSLDTESICRNWSEFADKIIQEAYEACQTQFTVKGDLCVFAYGKLGARELNLSSDIDLVFICEQPDENLVHWIRYFRELLQDKTEDGFCFRLDFDLRPGGRLGQIVCRLEEFEDYFSNYGEAWERLAFVRFRHIAGPVTLAEKCQLIAKRFTFRRHLDYSLIDDLKNLRQKIHEQNWRRSQNGNIDIKLGLGGIRDLELFVHTQQVIYGGRNSELQVGGTTEAITLLEKFKILDAKDSAFLKTHYWTLRHYENLLQALTDQQIQVLQTDFALEQISVTERDLLRNQMSNCDDLVRSLLGDIDQKLQSYPESDAEQTAWLFELGFTERFAETTWLELKNKRIFSRHREADYRKQQRFLYEILTEIALHKPLHEIGASRLSEFLQSIRAKATFFDLLLANQELIKKLANLFCHSGFLSATLTQKPELLDSLLFNTQQDSGNLDWEQCLEFWLEKKLLSQIRCGLDFLKDLDHEKATQSLSSVADDIVSDVLRKINHEYKTNLDILCLGKWGGFELGFQSDLDFIILTSETSTDSAARAARRLVSRLTEVQKGGSLYNLDLRLRPQSLGGLLITSFDDLLNYLQSTAKPWERQAYLKARWLNKKNAQLSELTHTQEVKKILAICCERSLEAHDMLELKNIQAQLFKKSRGALDLKYSPGGLVDIEFSTQITFLKIGYPPRNPSTRSQIQELTKRDARWLDVLNGYQELRKLEQLFRLLTQQSISHLSAENSEFLSLAVALHIDPELLSHRIVEILRHQSVNLQFLDPRRTSV